LIFTRRDKPNAQYLIPTTTKKPSLSNGIHYRDTDFF
jgi:hypothetical protein